MSEDVMTGKIRSRQEVAVLAQRTRIDGRVVGFTSGVFDLLHAGHVRSLTEAKRQVHFLAVGVNTDSSTRRIKGPLRPVVPLRDRLELLASLECVDVVFPFDEPNTQLTVRLLQPDVYFKGGDYSKERLSSAPIVESYGGQVVILPALAGRSTSATIRRIVENFRPEAEALRLPPPDRSRAIFLDRDGTINEHVDYLHDPARLVLIPGALDAVRTLRRLGYRIVVVTNQPGIGTGYFSEDDFFRVNKALLSAASKAGVLFDRVYFCPHSKGDCCTCRKPLPGMVERAVDELNIDLAASFVIGDMTSDIQLAKNTGCRSILLETGRAGQDREFPVDPDYRAANLLEASRLLERIGAAGSDRASSSSSLVIRP